MNIGFRLSDDQKGKVYSLESSQVCDSSICQLKRGTNVTFTVHFTTGTVYFYSYCYRTFNIIYSSWMGFGQNTPTEVNLPPNPICLSLLWTGPDT